MRQCYKDRLLILAKHLSKVEDSKFDISIYIRADNNYSGKENAEMYRKGCGTTACALGHACLIHEFNKSNLDIRFNRPEFTTKNNTYYYLDAGEKFFGLTQKEADSLFLYDGYKSGYKTTAKQVARKIRKLVKEKSTMKV